MSWVPDLGTGAPFVGPRSGLRYCHPTPDQADRLEALELDSFPTAHPDDLYRSSELHVLAQDFPLGNFVASEHGRAVAMGLGIRRDFDFSLKTHSVQDIYAVDGESGHQPDGEWYYGTSIAVRPEYRRRGIGGELYALRKAVCRHLGLAGIVAGGVIPGYAEHKHAMSADEYIDQVRSGDLYDATLTFQLENGFEVRGAITDYMRDPAVDNYAALIVWHNSDR